MVFLPLHLQIVKNLILINYLILQREVDDLEYYYYEINSQQYSGIGGFKKVEIYSDKLVIYFQEKQKIYQNSIEKSNYYLST
mgnify:CR=1 FL=1